LIDSQVIDANMKQQVL